jgi:hypothetical protein
LRIHDLLKFQVRNTAGYGLSFHLKFRYQDTNSPAFEALLKGNESIRIKVSKTALQDTDMQCKNQVLLRKFH